MTVNHTIREDLTHDELRSAALELVEPIVRSAARRHRLTAEDADDLASVVRLKLLQDNGAVLQKFEGRSSLRTYLTVVVHPLLLDERVARWGRWRPSAAARRAGPAALLLERLMVRDGVGFEEACETIERNHGLAVDRAALAQFSATVAARSRAVQVQLEPEHEPAAPERADDRVLERAGATTMRRAAKALRVAVAALDPQDASILTLRYEHGQSVPAIARELAVNEKALYRRLPRVLRQVRAVLEQHGLAAAEVREALREAR
jgi:RNA polymerase sigma factor for flagellar operon FliA